MTHWASRWWPLWPIAALVACVLTSSADKIIGTYLPDDAYFYLTIARHWVNGIPSSFSGIDTTNGYHPLWAWVLVPVLAALDHLEPERIVPLIILGQLAIHAVSAALLGTLVPHNRVLVISVFAFLCVLPSWYGLEIPLAICLFLVFWKSALSTGSVHPLGISAGALILCRLDAALLIGPVLAMVAWRRRSQGESALKWGAPLVLPLLLIAPYLTWNLAEFGHVLPISGALKSSFPEPRLLNLPWQSVRWVRLLVPFALASACLWGSRRRESTEAVPAPRTSLAPALFAGICLFYVYECFFQRDAYWAQFSWHFGVPSAAACVLLGEVRLGERRWAEISATAAATLASTAMMLWRFLPSAPSDPGMLQYLEAGRWVASRTSPDAVVAATDAGVISFVGRRKTINLDGLVNDFEYQKILKEDRLHEYLDARGTTHLAILQQRIERTGACRCYRVIGRLHEVEVTLCSPERTVLHQTFNGSIALSSYARPGRRLFEECSSTGPARDVRSDSGAAVTPAP